MNRRRWSWYVIAALPGLLAATPYSEIIPAAFTVPVGNEMPTGRHGSLPDRVPAGTPNYHKPIVDIPPGALPSLLRDPGERRSGDPMPLEPGYRPPARSSDTDYNPNYLYLPDRVPDRPLLVNVPHQPSGKFWLNAGYFYGTTQHASIPPLLLEGGTPVSLPGPGGLISALGEEISEHHFRSGLQFQGGLWLDKEESFSAQGEVFLLESNRATSAVGSLGEQSLARPYIEGSSGELSLSPIAGPDVGFGKAEVSSDMSLIGAQANLRQTVWTLKPAKLDLIGGYRFFRLSETLRVASDGTRTVSGPGIPVGTRTQLLDAFETDNNFHGGQIGMAGEYRWNRLFVDVTGTVAFGANFQDDAVHGGELVTTPGSGLTSKSYGLLAAETNSGELSRERFAVMPAASVTFGYAWTDHWRTFLGYRFLYINEVTRPGELIDLTVGDDRPVRGQPDAGFWVQGVILGLEMRY